MEESRPDVNRETQESAQLAERFEQLRVKLGLSQEQFSDGVGISLRGYTNWMGGTRIPASAIIEAVTRFGASADWLITGSGEMLRTSIPKFSGATSNATFLELPKGSRLPGMWAALQAAEDSAAAIRAQIELEIEALQRRSTRAGPDLEETDRAPPSTDPKHP